MAIEEPSADKDMIARFISVITRDWPADTQEDGLFELRCLGENRTPVVERFALHAFDEAVDLAYEMNLRKLNIYMTINPIGNAAVAAAGGAAKDEDIVRAHYSFADADDQKGMYGLKKLGEIIKPDMIVTTGTSPHKRQHAYWRLDEPCRDMTLWRSWQSQIAAQYDTDPVVINPSRIMRVAGTVSYPSDKKRKKDYIAELVTLEVCDQEQSQLHAIEAWGEIILPLTATKPEAGPLISTKLDRQGASEAAKQGKDWHKNVLGLVASWVAKGNTDEEIQAMAAQHRLSGYSLDETRDEVQKMINGARKKGFDSYLPARPCFDDLGLTLKRNGEPYPNVHNIFVVFMNTPEWSGVFAYDEFSDRERIIKRPPYEAGIDKNYIQRDLREDDFTQTHAWLNKNGFPTIGRDAVMHTVGLLCREAIISPVRHYLESLSFDPDTQPLLAECWLEDYLGVKPETDQERAYIQAIAVKSLVQAVARALDPGCKADSVPILEGEQGSGKSTAIRMLFGEDWFGDALPPMGHKDASDYLRGKWAIELAEMSFQSKADIEQQKAFISRQEERYRPAYGRLEIKYARRCVFWATTNRDDYLKDETGNRRFWPIKTGDIDIEGLLAARDQLWAEAVYHYKQGMQWWLDPKMQGFAEKQNQLRFENDAWEQDVKQWADSNSIEDTTVRDALNGALFITADRMTQSDQRRMRLVLKKIGFQKDGVYKDKVRRDQARYVRKMG